MIHRLINGVWQAVRGSSKVERLLVKETAVGSSPTPGAISRRKFFSFMTCGATMLAKPDLFLKPKPTRPSSVTVWFPVETEVRFAEEGDLWFDGPAGKLWVFHNGEWRKTLFV